MGISLTGLTPATTYDALIKVGDNGPITGALKVLSDGLGTNLPMEASTTAINFTGVLTQAGTTLQPTLVSGTNIKTINSTSLLGSGDIVTPQPSGVAGAIQFSNGSAFASDATKLFWDDTNNRLGVGTNTPTATTHIVGANNSSSSSALRILNSVGQGILSVTNDGFTQIGDFTGQGYGSFLAFLRPSGSTRVTTFNQGNSNLVITNTNGNVTYQNTPVQIVGSGSTSATTSLLVQNSAGVSSLQVTDDGSVYNLGKGAITSNSGFGRLALINNTTGANNTANGVSGLQNNTTGSANTADGVSALASNLTGSNNCAIGRSSLTFMTAGSQNTAVGAVALYSTTSSNNTAVGYEAGFANTTGANNTLLGQNTVTGNFSGSVIIGKDAIATTSNQFVVGSTGTNAGSVVAEVNTSTNVWNVVINGVARKILLA